MRILFQMVGGQTVPNYCAYRIVQPDKSIYFYTKDSIDKLNAIKNVITQESEFVEIDAYDIPKIMKDIEKYTSKYDEDELIMNFTAGTKPMTIAAYEVFNKLHRHMIYIDSENIFYYQLEKEKPVSKNSFKNISISPKPYFQLHEHEINDSFSIDEYCKNSNYVNVAEYLLKNYTKYNKEILDFATKFNDFKNRNYLQYESRYIFKLS